MCSSRSNTGYRLDKWPYRCSVLKALECTSNVPRTTDPNLLQKEDFTKQIDLATIFKTRFRYFRVNTWTFRPSTLLNQENTNKRAVLQMAPLPHKAAPEWLGRQDIDMANESITRELTKNLVRIHSNSLCWNLLDNCIFAMARLGSKQWSFFQN